MPIIGEQLNDRIMINLYELLEVSNGQLFGEPAAQLFDDFCVDAEFASINQLFVVLQTEQGDTHQYIELAIKNGASGVVCTRPPECATDGVSVLLVQDTTAALMAWAHYILGKYGTKVIAVSGSAGKSVTADAIARVLSQKYHVYTNIKQGDGRLAIPLALSHLTPNHKFAVLKLGVTQAGDMAAMVQAVQPEVAIVTHVGDYFVQGFQNENDIIEEQAILVDYLSPSGLAVLNYDDDRSRPMKTRTRAKVFTVGIDTFGADLIAYNVNMTSAGTTFDVRHGSKRLMGHSVPLFGKYHLYSILMAAAVGLHYEIALEDSLTTLAEIDPLPGRMNPLAGINGSLIVDDTYSANPTSTFGVLEWIEAIKKYDDKRRVFFVFGDMENLGQNARQSHRMLGERVAQVADVLITQGTNAAITARAAMDYGMEHVHMTHAIHDSINILTHQYQLHADDVLVIKGGAASRMELIVQALLANPNDIRELVRQQTDKTSLSQSPRLTWVEIDKEALANNIRLVKSYVGDDVAVLAVVKANAYGHGAVLTARTAILNGATYLGVSSVQEGLELREAGIDAPILIMNYTPPSMVRQAIQHDMTLTLYDMNLARAYDRIGREVNRHVKVHLKVDTGMGRLGALQEGVLNLFRHLLVMQYIEIEGIYTHFSVADSDKSFTEKQIQAFRDIIRPLQATTGFKFKYIHACNSAGMLAHKDAHFNMVRPGIALYGMHPSSEVPLFDGFKPVLTWKTVIAQVKTLPDKHYVGYGNTYQTSGAERVAVIPVGYADGFRRAPNPWQYVLVHGQRAPVIGRVSMEKTTISVQHIPDVSVGDEVVLLGRQGDEIITAEDIAKWLGTINYEVTCAALPRAPRY
ncbi:MAG: alanine racemase [Phototrophicales bacterium]|nr:MAG: alanine racemase [Phototrophicales bacterium]RMG71670.1 MAG: alanine racemase [Chloroflexota bacterium]